jgi:phenol 2-monooxygenase
MDVLAVTDFPDIRLKSAIQSAGDGAMLIIPREGGYLVRMYIELGELQGDERAADRNVTAEMLTDRATAILAPYTLDVKQVAWWSAYEIGQRVCDRFDDGPDQPPRIFIAGDACHTHSPKAGQGMNVSMADSFNLGWKLAAVLRGQSNAALLDTYTSERQAKAQELIDFDKDMAHLFSAKAETPQDAAKFQQYFKKHGRFTAGVETQYAPSPITGTQAHQSLATGFSLGKRFHSTPVMRLADGKPMQLGHMLLADGRWRIIAFGSRTDIGQTGDGIANLCQFLEHSPQSPQVKFTPKGQDADSIIDLRAVLQADHRCLAMDQLPKWLFPTKGKLGLTDYEKVFCPDIRHGPNIFDLRGINRDTGALIVVRPDQHVAQVLPLDAYTSLTDFFDGFMLAAN